MASSPLRDYNRKRDFTRTAEPRGRLSGPKSKKLAGHLFVVHKHAARRLHYDLRLELDGVLKSWAVTRGPSLSPKDKRLAVRVEDHPLDYAEFEGRIPEGEYGAGSVIVWDRGRWTSEGDPHKQLAKGHLEIDLDGTKLKGRWHLVHMKGRDKGGKRGGKENWLLIKADDEYAREDGGENVLDEAPTSVKTGRTIEAVGRSGVKIRRKSEGNGRESSGASAPAEPSAGSEDGAKGPDPIVAAKISGAKRSSLPTFLPPQLASLADRPPAGERWVHEIKFDGYRLQARIDGGKVRLKTRTGLDWTAKFFSVQKALEKLPVVTALLDGEVIVETEQGTPDFGTLQQDLSEGRSDRFCYYLFDLLHLDGIDLSRASLIDRKRVLAQLLAGRSDGVLKLSEHFTEDGDVVLRHACRLSLEGIVSKLASAPYRSGRSKAWLKSKCTDSDEFVVIGYVPSTTQRRTVGSLVLGYFDKGRLVYAGRVGSGFSTAVADDLWRRLEAIRIAAPDLDPLPPAEARRNVRWVKPQLVAEVEMRGWTADGILRHSVFKGLRQDKDAADVAPERPVVKARSKTTKSAKASRASKAESAAAPAVSLTHPDRVLWPDVGVTKQGLAEFYAEIWPQISPHVVGRPLALVRCPGGVEEGCFFQKHAWAGITEHVTRSRDPEDDEELLSVDSLEGLLSLVQASVLEIHVWGARLTDLERPDGITFDLDPAPEVEWTDVVAAAFEVRERLEKLGLQSFVKTTGGKGLHVYAPLVPHAGWAAVKDFTHKLAAAMAKDSPQRYLATASKAARRGRIFVDYLRNGRGATAVAAYSARARAGAAVSTPLGWEELGPEMRPDRFTVTNLLNRLANIDDPWRNVRKSARRLPS